MSTEGFASLYLSLEPPGGSPQPTDPLSRIPLGGPAAESVIEVSSPVNGATLTTDSVIVRGTLGDGVRELQYQLDGGPLTQAPLSGNRFTFTLSGLRPGENRLELRATTADGATSSARLTLRAWSVGRLERKGVTFYEVVDIQPSLSQALQNSVHQTWYTVQKKEKPITSSHRHG